MNIDAVVLELAYAERLPRQTLQACLRRRDEFVPDFLRLLERAADGEPLAEVEEAALFYFVHLLGELGEKRAYPPLMRLLAGNAKRIERVLGDGITETLPGIIISVFDGTTDALYGVMNAPEAHEFARDAAFVAWAYYVTTGDIPTEEARQYLAACPERLEPRGESYVWVSWAQAVAVLGLADLAPRVREVVEAGRLPEFTLDYAEFERLLRESLDTTDREAFLESERMAPFTDTIGTLSRWHGFSEQYHRSRRRAEIAERAADTVKNAYRHVGRNDPCPCGSGKKFKRCCLNAAAQ